MAPKTRKSNEWNFPIPEEEYKHILTENIYYNWDDGANDDYFATWYNLGDALKEKTIAEVAENTIFDLFQDEIEAYTEETFKVGIKAGMSYALEQIAKTQKELGEQLGLSTLAPLERDGNA